MHVATVLFVDIEGFSRKNAALQIQLTESLSAAVQRLVGQWLQPDVAEPVVVALPTGDGVALVFVAPERGASTWDFDDVIRTAYGLTEWARSHGVCLYLGIHKSSVQRVKDVNGQANVCGDAINVAQRVMSAADAGQVLISDDAIRHFLGSGSGEKVRPLLIEDRKFTLRVKETIDVHAKHGLRVALAPAALIDPNDKPVWGWDDHEPSSAGVLPVKLTPKGTPVVGDFAGRLAEARSVALVQLTGARLLAKLQACEVRLSEDLERFWVFLPAAAAVGAAEQQKGLAPMNQLTGLAKAREGWVSYLRQLRSDRPQAQVQLMIYGVPPFFGASFLDWDRLGGTIHVSPYVWGLDSPDCPGFDLVWQAERQHYVFKAYVDGLERLRGDSPELGLG